MVLTFPGPHSSTVLTKLQWASQAFQGFPSLYLRYAIDARTFHGPGSVSPWLAIVVFVLEVREQPLPECCK
jgi:hypothetical protein